MANTHSNKNLIARRYAQALFDLASQGKEIANVSDDLAKIHAVLDESKDLLTVFGSPTIPRAEIQSAALAVFAKLKISKLTTQFCTVAGTHGRLSILPEIVNAYNNLVSVSKGEVTAIVTSAAPLKKTTAKQIANSLSKATGSTVLIEEHVDEALLGGLTVKIDSHMLDSSLAGKLERMERYLKQAS